MSVTWGRGYGSRRALLRCAHTPWLQPKDCWGISPPWPSWVRPFSLRVRTALSGLAWGSHTWRQRPPPCSHCLGRWALSVTSARVPLGAWRALEKPVAVLPNRSQGGRAAVQNSPVFPTGFKGRTASSTLVCSVPLEPGATLDSVSCWLRGAWGSGEGGARASGWHHRSGAATSHRIIPQAVRPSFRSRLTAVRLRPPRCRGRWAFRLPPPPGLRANWCFGSRPL